MRSNRRRGFTLIELLLVMVILAVLAAIVIPRFAGRGEEAKEKATITQIAQFGVALDLYEADNGKYPTTAQGLDALQVLPTTTPEPKNWHGPYLKRAIPLDPWENPYVYACPGQQSPAGYDLHSYGPDGRDGTEDDLTSW